MTTQSSVTPQPSFSAVTSRTRSAWGTCKPLRTREARGALDQVLNVSQALGGYRVRNS